MPVNLREVTCSTCIYYRPETGNKGRCMFKPPTSTKGLPETMSDARCGYHCSEDGTRALYMRTPYDCKED